MSDTSRLPAPPAELLSESHTAVAPEARTVVSEVRSNATICFDPRDPPTYLRISTNGFGSLMVARLDASWEHGHRILAWLKAAPPAGIPGRNQEEALKDIIEALETGDPPTAFLRYVGIYLAGDAAHAKFTAIFGFQRPVSCVDYRNAWADKLDGLRKTAPAWHAAVLDFMRLYFGQATSTEEWLMLASSTDDLKDPAKFPIISQLIP